MLRIDCPECGASVSHANRNQKERLAKCINCDNVFRSIDKLEPQPPRPLPPKPTHISIVSLSNQFAVEVGWIRSSLLFGIIMLGIFVGAFVLLGRDVGGVFFEMLVDLWPMGLWFGLILAPFILPSIWDIYHGVACWFNSTTLEIDDRLLTVQHGPIPWPGKVAINHSEIVQLYGMKLHSYPGKLDRYTRRRGDYVLYAMLADESVLRIASGLSEDEILYIEPVLEQRLNIEDRPVEGEINAARWNRKRVNPFFRPKT